MVKLTDRKCIPCEGGVEPLSSDQVEVLLRELDPAWTFADNIKIERIYNFDDYQGVIGFANQVASLAEEEGHHPVMTLFFSKVKVELWTHAILGLSENDFIHAAKIDALYKHHGTKKN